MHGDRTGALRRNAQWQKIVARRSRAMVAGHAMLFEVKRAQMFLAQHKIPHCAGMHGDRTGAELPNSQLGEKYRSSFSPT